MRLEDLAPVPGVRHRTVSAGAVDLHVAEAGNGPPLLLLHGWPQHWWSFRKLIPRLAERYRVIAPDLRGWGWSDAPPGDYAKATFAADVRALLDAEGLDRVRIVGHDWGGYAAFLLALEHPERVERMVGLDIPPPWRTPFHAGQLLFAPFATYQVALATPGLGRRLMTSGRLVPLLLRLGSGRRFRFGAEEVAAYTEPLREPARAAASVACYRTFLGRELLAQARRRNDLRVPVLLLMGEAGMLRRIVGDPGIPTEVVPDAGHFLAEEAPDDVLRLAEPFLAQT
jgi:pimeloyl-ACP methyl ester carboxylesterase